MSEGARMERFWDARAQEDPFYFVDSRLRYGSPDLERFWADGAADLDRLLAIAGVAVEPDHTVVEVGCGLGRMTRVLAERAQEVFALDVSSAMLRRARELNPQIENVRWMHGDGTSLAGIGDGAADACVSHVVFQHIPDPRTVLGYVREMGRVLRHGGWAAFQVSNDPDLHRPWRSPLLPRLLGSAPRGRRHPAWVGSAIDLGALRESAAQAGLSVERVWGEGTQFCIVRLRRTD
jgi:SAM-dependent methyltransferase